MELGILENKVVVAAPPLPLAQWRGYCWLRHWNEGEDCYYSFIRLKGRGSGLLL